MDLSFVIPTHNRPETLAQTLSRMGELDPATIGHDAELIVVDNSSTPRLKVPKALPNGMPVFLVQLTENIGAAARNAGVERARGDWIVMLDDDSSLLRSPAIYTLRSMPKDVHAVGGEIYLPSGKHESGGLPEVVIGCGCAYRRSVFLELGGYDQSFDFYAEEYDLCAKILLKSGRVIHHSGLQFEHRKTAHGRSFSRIIHRLVRNNGWVIARYAPHHLLQDALERMKARYRAIALKEDSMVGFEAGLVELNATIGHQPRQEMSQAQWDRFVGIAAARNWLANHLGTIEIMPTLVHMGKGAEEIIQVLNEMGGVSHRPPNSGGDGSRQLIGTLSPGPICDAQELSPAALRAWSGIDEPDF